MSFLPTSSRLLPRLRTLLAVTAVASASVASAFCHPPQNSVDWMFVGEIAQNIRVRTVSHRAISGWSTLDSMANRLSTSIRHTLSAGQTETVSVTARLLYFSLGSNSSVTTTHSVDVTIPPGHRARLLRQRREEVQEYTYDVHCAWRNLRTGQNAMTLYGSNYRDTLVWRYDAFETREERI